jgi:hypothetical protein
VPFLKDTCCLMLTMLGDEKLVQQEKLL